MKLQSRVAASGWGASSRRSCVDQAPAVLKPASRSCAVAAAAQRPSEPNRRTRASRPPSVRTGVIEFMPRLMKTAPSGSTSHQRSRIRSTRKKPEGVARRASSPPNRSSGPSIGSGGSSSSVVVACSTNGIPGLTAASIVRPLVGDAAGHDTADQATAATMIHCPPGTALAISSFSSKLGADTSARGGPLRSFRPWGRPRLAGH